MANCFDFDIPGPKGKITGKYYVEGHKSKANWEDENTLIIQSDQGFETLDEATAKAREYFDREKDLGLAVIFQQDEEGAKEGIKMIFRDDEGNLEESTLFY
jgi:hypothetical protein